jgi:hypothetical protein
MYTKKLFTLALLTLIFCYSCSGTSRSIKNTDFSYFKIAFEQNGEYHFPIDNKVSLKNAPFSILVYLNIPDGILVNASLHDDSYEAMITGLPEKDIQGFKKNNLPDEISNSNNTLLISKQSPSYWYYINEQDNVFNQIEKISKNIILCERKIDKVKNMDSNQTLSTLNIEDINFKQVYLCFLKSDWSNDFKTRIELKREAIILNFE